MKAGLLRACEILEYYHVKHNEEWDFIVKLRNGKPYFHDGCFLCDCLKELTEILNKEAFSERRSWMSIEETLIRHTMYMDELHKRIMKLEKLVPHESEGKECKLQTIKGEFATEEFCSHGIDKHYCHKCSEPKPQPKCPSKDCIHQCVGKVKEGVPCPNYSPKSDSKKLAQVLAENFYQVMFDWARHENKDAWKLVASKAISVFLELIEECDCNITFSDSVFKNEKIILKDELKKRLEGLR